VRGLVEDMVALFVNPNAPKRVFHNPQQLLSEP
jgi:hypothetical protein